MKPALLTLLCICFAISSFSQAPQVTSVSPSSQSLTALPTDQIVVNFDTPIDPTTVDQNSFMVFGRWSGPMDGSLSLNEAETSITFTPDRDFFYGEWVSVRLTSSIQSTIGEALANGYGFNYWTKTVPAFLNLALKNQFSAELSGETFIQCYGAYAGDVNDDEFSDLVVITEAAEDIRVFLNDGQGDYNTFTIFDMPNAAKPSTNEGSDFDHDGKIDIAIGSIQNDNVSVFMGDDSTIFGPELGFTADDGIRGLTVIDINGDGWDDIATANRNASTYSILINDGTGQFGAPTTMDAGVDSETSIAAVDLNNDGIIDLAIGGFNSSNVVTLINDGQGNFTQQDITGISGSPWMLAAGDVNGDSNVDIISVNSNVGEVSILFGDGAGNLTLDASYSVGTFSLAIDVGDIDGDGDLDFISSNFSTSDFTLYENFGNGTFGNPITYDAVQAGSCAILHDRNNDGAMDITLVDEIEDVIILYENTPSLSIEDEDFQLQTSISPNPFSYQITISGNQVVGATFRLFDVQGRILHSEIVTDSKNIDLSKLQLANGMYIAQLQNGNKTSSTQLIKSTR